jgi:hypothetical protein
VVRLLVKDHKPLQANALYPTCLIISAHNFTQCLSKLVLTLIKHTFRHGGINFEQFTLKNSLHMKWWFKSKQFVRNDVTIVSLDIKDMYPQCLFKAVQTAVISCTSHLPTLQQEQIRKCHDIIKFSRGYTNVKFRDKYYKYGVDPDPDWQGWTELAAWNQPFWQTSRQCTYLRSCTTSSIDKSASLEWTTRMSSSSSVANNLITDYAIGW